MLNKPHFFAIWTVVLVLYLGAILAYGLATGGVAVPASILANMLTLAGALVISLTITIPTYLLWFDAYTERQYGDLPVGTTEGPVRPLISRRIARLHVRLWMLFAFLLAVTPLALMARTFLPELLHTPASAAPTAVLPAAPTSTPVTTPAPAGPDISTLPKYGGAEKTDAQEEADDEFVATIIAQTGSRDAALTLTIAKGQQAFALHDADTAMRRFNQAWLIDATSTDALWGMGLVEGVRGHFDRSIDLILQALSLDPSRADMRCDLGVSYYNKALADTDKRGELLSLADEQFVLADAASSTTPTCRTAWDEVKAAQAAD